MVCAFIVHMNIKTHSTVRGLLSTVYGNPEIVVENRRVALRKTPRFSSENVRGMLRLTPLESSESQTTPAKDS
jgi:hypothetical protein